MLVVWLVLGLYIGIGLHINYRGDKSAPSPSGKALGFGPSIRRFGRRRR